MLEEYQRRMLTLDGTGWIVKRYAMFGYSVVFVGRTYFLVAKMVKRFLQRAARREIAC